MGTFRLFVLTAALSIGMSSCSTLERARHAYLMRGQVLRVTDGVAYVCVGTADGAKAGQHLNVYRFVQTRALPSPRTGVEDIQFQTVDTGHVTITEIVNQHYARARIDSGEIGVGDIVELRAE